MPTNRNTVGRDVLFIGSSTHEHEALRQILTDSPWKLQGAFTAGDGLGLLRTARRDIFVVICEHRLPDGDWKDVLAALDEMPQRPALIVTSRLADERLWAEVISLGAFDLLLGSPFRPEEVLRATDSAWRASRSAGTPAETRRSRTKSSSRTQGARVAPSGAGGSL